MTWYRVKITATESADDKHGQLQDLFTELFMQAGPARKDFALLSGGVHFGVPDYFYIYFSPACGESKPFKDLIDSFDGAPCQEPTDREAEPELISLVCDPSAWNDLLRWPNL